jgi:hypothetical protein
MNGSSLSLALHLRLWYDNAGRMRVTTNRHHFGPPRLVGKLSGCIG